jgi:hypothetical protein
MSTNDETVIELSKGKMVLMLLGAVAFVGIGIWFLTLDAEAIRAGRSFRLFFNSPAFAYGLGVLSIVFFGGVGVFIVKKLFDIKPGLIFNREGIIDNASVASPGFIPWSEITGIDIFEINGQKMLIVMLTDPQKYADRGNFLIRKLNNANAKMSGSPIYISANTLKIAFPQLVSLFEQYHQKYGDLSYH